MPEMEKMGKESIGRKMLADISNIQRQPTGTSQDAKSRTSSATMKEYIEQLQKENAALMKLLADKNRIIELSGAELQKQRITLQKMQQQNLQFAQSNSQMLAELNGGRDRLKELQHEIGCKYGLIIAKKLEGMGMGKGKGKGKGKSKSCGIKKKKACEDEEMVASVGKDNGIGRVGDEAKAKEEDVDVDGMKEDAGRRRSSMSRPRPSREAAKKVQSYKEINMKVKLRRTE